MGFTATSFPMSIASPIDTRQPQRHVGQALADEALS